MSLPLRVLGGAAAPRVIGGGRTPKGSPKDGPAASFFMDLPRTPMGAMSPKTPRTPKTPKSPMTPKTPLGFYLEERQKMGQASPHLVPSPKSRDAEKWVETRPVLLGRATSMRPFPAPSATSSPPSSTRRVCFEQDSALLSTVAREAYIGRQRRIRDRFGTFRV
mmetsp:Transcript_58916/g.104723  ORF Transcript_58916/g.104723 Transcript_58916/m.104723 type:complete len:164 (+) Transcript_58916:91-582(+)|eukprot:CAMPEP_0197624458 /NCGR_PEP_ID=MMETSP1338-20131121/4087_1 /TAXON_ID=43686 ORGANISM="Pelagodinium beii, Strain RCC1491" /NCGR_SAMPLE_ID=MMETSP1338 /ASSEMBLY_ACC=CAM_ASM_000754 /LENGTH=163 /DNA_ID=CAMNT_0043194595 /DNA_START=88 /DNA_END=579 /DNA_ORIENTATION=+